MAGGPSRSAPRWRLRVIVALLLIVLLVVGAASSPVWRPQLADLRSRISGVKAASPKTTTSTSAQLEAFIPIAERFVEAHRGLKFKQPVKVTFLADAPFRERLLGKETQDKASIERDTKVLRALGLIDATVDLAKAEQSLLGGSVLGYYDPKTKELVVRGVKPGPAVHHVLVHELTHALQDQQFSIDSGDSKSTNDEKAEAFSGLVEGDAVRIERQYIASLSASEQDQLKKDEAGQASGISGDIPQALLEMLGFPYLIGPPFTEAILQAKGQAGLDAAFTNRPSTTSQLLHPDKFLAGRTAKTVDVPAADGKIIDSGVLGEWGLDLVLENLITSKALTLDAFRRATTGWAGDQYVAWDQGSKACVRDRIVTETPADSVALVGALQKFAASRQGVTVQGAGPVVLTSCG